MTDQGMQPGCLAHTGPIWKLGGEPCGCVLPADHSPAADHRCDCGKWSLLILVGQAERGIQVQLTAEALAELLAGPVLE